MKNTKRILSFVLSLAMIVSCFAIAAVADDEKYSTLMSWGPAAFGNMEDTGITTEVAEGGSAVYNRNEAVGVQGYGIYGYMTYGHGVAVTANHNYKVTVDVLYSGKNCITKEDERLFQADAYDNQDNTVQTPAITADAFFAAYEAAELKQNPNNGTFYKNIEIGTLTVPVDDTDCEFRCWTCGFAEFRFYTMYVYDVTDASNEQLVLTVNGGDNFGNDFDGICDDDGMIENDTYDLAKGYRVFKKADTSVLALGNMGGELEAGKYVAKSTVRIDDAETGDLFTVKVLKGSETVAEKTYTDTDIVKDRARKNSQFNDGTVSVELPFDVSEKGEYTVNVYTTGKATVTVQEVSIDISIDAADVSALEAKITALGDVEITDEYAAKLADVASSIEAFNAKYGTGAASKNVSNYKDYETKNSAYEAGKAELALMNEAAAKVTAAIDALPETIEYTDECNDLITAAEDLRDGFNDTYAEKYGENKLAELVGQEKLDKLAKAREDYNKLAVKPGDMDKNGKVDVNDALKVLQIAVGKIEATEAETAIADVDQSGKVDVNDALQVLQMAVGKITEYKLASK